MKNVLHKQNESGSLNIKSGTRNRAQIVLRAAICALSATMLFSKPATAEFNTYDLFGVGAVSSSIGGISVGSKSDQLEYLINPSLINQFEATRYTLSLSRGGENDTLYSTDYSNLIFSYASDKKAYTLMLDNENKWTRDMLTYTAYLPYGKGQYDLGANISAFRYTKPAEYSSDPRQAPLPEDQGSGFSTGVGASKTFPNKMKAGFAIQNLVGFGSAVKTFLRPGGEAIRLPRIINIGVSYPYKERFVLYAGIKSLSLTPDSGKARNGTMMYLGAEMELQGNASRSGRMGLAANNSLTGYDDKEILYGGSMEMKKYMAAGYAAQKNDPSDRVVGLTVSYKPDEKLPWKGAPPAPELVPIDIPLKSETDKNKFEEPLPAAITEKTETPEPVQPEKTEKTDNTKKTTPIVEKTRTKVAAFDVSPKVMILPSRSKASMSMAKGHWSEPYYKSLAADGFYASAPVDRYELNGLVNRDEYYRLLFVAQLTELFIDPIAVTFNTPYAVGAELWLDSPMLENPVLLQEGTYERAGMKRLVVSMDMLQDKEILPGKYKVTLKLSAEDMLPEELENYITIIDTSVDFSAITSLPVAERKQRVDSFKDSMKQLGIKVDYLDGLNANGPITRMEALRVMMESSSVDLPSEFNKEEMTFADVWQLDATDQAVVFLASRGMFSLNGLSLMGGYSDGRFRPEKEMTNAEAAALVDRYRKVTIKDFEPPYQIAVAPESPAKREPAVRTQTSDTGSGLAPLPLPGESYQDAERSYRVKYLAVAGSFMDEANARKTVQMVKDNGMEPDYIVEKIGVVEVYHVVLGKFDNHDDAEKYISRLAPIAGIDYKITLFLSGDEMAYSKGHSQLGERKRTEKRVSKDAEGTLNMDGDSFLPWNLIRNLNDFSPPPVESGGYVVE